MVRASSLFLVIFGSSTCGSLAGDCSHGDCRILDDSTDMDSANSFLQMSSMATRHERTVRAHDSRLFANITTTSAVKPFNCNKYRQPIQVMQATKEYVDGYIVAELDRDRGEYDLIWKIPYTKTNPPWADINACGLNPIDEKVYCAIMAGGSFVIRMDDQTIEFVAWLPFSLFNSGAFSDSGIYYVSTPQGYLMVIEGLASKPGYTDLAEAKSSKKLYDCRKFPRVKPAGWYLTSDLVATTYDFGDGESEYVMSVYGPGLQIAKYDVKKKSFDGSWKLDVSPARWDNVYGAAWNFRSRLYFGSNRGSGVYELKLSDIDLKSTDRIVLPRIVGNEASMNNDGFNCQHLGSPFLTTIIPFDCKKHPQPIHLIKVENEKATAKNWRLPAKEYIVGNANFTTGQITTIYKVPSNLTDPPFVSLNAAGINPKDSIAYGAVKLNWWPAPDKPSPCYIVRFDSGLIEFLAKVQGKADCIAGTFDEDGTFFVAAHPNLWAFAKIDTWKGFPNASSPGLPSYNVTDGIELKDVKQLADMVVVKGKFDQRAEAPYLLSMNQMQQLSLTNLVTEEHTVIKINKIHKATDGGGNFGAAWNFKGQVYFSSNDGEGVYKIPLDKINTQTKAAVKVEKVGSSITINDNDGMNCMEVSKPDTLLLDVVDA